MKLIGLNDMITQAVRQYMTDYLQSKAFKSALEQNGVLFKGQQSISWIRNKLGLNSREVTKKKKMSGGR